jgi:DNA-binding transcriptional LysR family regulator
MNVTLRHLRVFVEICRHASFTRAAEALFVSQSALTLTIKQLESELGLALLERTTRSVAVTAAGDEFLPVAQKLLRDFDSSLGDVKALALRESGHVGVATAPSIMSLVMADVVAQYVASYPNISLYLREDNAVAVQERVRSADVDFGLTTKVKADPELSFEPLFHNPFGVVFAPDHPLGRKRGKLKWADLVPYRIVGYTADTGMQGLLTSAEGLPEQVKNPFYRVSSTAVITALVGRGLGVSVMPSLAALRDPLSTLTFRLLEEPRLTREISLVRRAGRSLSPAAESMLALVRAGIVTLGEREDSRTSLPPRPRSARS